jgi:hypothetical protein
LHQALDGDRGRKDRHRLIGSNESGRRPEAAVVSDLDLDAAS